MKKENYTNYQPLLLHSFIVHTRDGRVQAYVDMSPTRYMLLNEGDCTKIVTGCSTPPAGIIARIEITEPSFHCL